MSHFSRREFLTRLSYGIGAASLCNMFPGFMGNSNCFASTGNGNKVLFVNLNGGLDGLAALQPVSGGAYSTLQSLRPTLAKAPGDLLSLDGNYALHPNLTAFKSLYDEGKLTALLNVGYLNMSRSHLDSEVAMARGVSDRLSASSSGLINRMGAQYNWTSLQAVSVSGSDRMFDGGEYRGIQVNGLENFYFKGQNYVSTHEGNYRRDTLYSIVADTEAEPENPLLQDSVSSLDIAVNSTDSVKAAVSATTFPNAYPNTRMGRVFKDVDILFSTPSLGTQVSYIRMIGYDTHSNQDVVLNSNLTALNNSFAAFVANMKAKGLWNNLIVVFLSEFGRTNKENGSSGTDHGGANPVFITGGLSQSTIVGSVTTNDLTSGLWLPMKINILEVYRQVVAKLGYDPDSVMETPLTTVLPQLFS